MFYYFLVLAAALLFGGNFFVNGKYQQSCGASLLTSVVLAFGTGASGLLMLLAINGFSLHATPFTAVMGALFGINAIVFSVFTIYALERASLSLFSLFSMMGGMFLPSVVGILFYGEPFTLGKLLCYLFTTVGLCFTVKKGENKKAFLCYAGVFFFNGLAASLSVIHSYGNYARASAADYSIIGSIFKAVIAAAMIPFLVKALRKKTAAEPAGAPSVSPAKKYLSWKVIVFLCLCGVFSTMGNYLLAKAMQDGGVPGSVQYPMITGGVTIISTLLGYLNRRKPTKKEIVAVCICFVGMLCMLIPADLTVAGLLGL